MNARVNRLPRLLLLVLACTQLSAVWPGAGRQPVPVGHAGAMFRTQFEPDTQVLRSTLEIVTLSNSAGSVVGVMSLGALVYQDGLPRLYTHNHYDANPELPLSGVVRVLFLNSAGEYVAQIGGPEFRRLLAGARDPGTAMLEVPPELKPAALAQLQGVSLIPVYAQMGAARGLARGSAVSVAHRGTPGASIKQETLTVLRAVVESTDRRGSGGAPLFRLRTSSGLALVGGDSGGPIWYRGQVVGNTWSMILDAAGQSTGAFWAAQAPAY